MPTVTAATLTKQFGRWRDLAQREPVSITHHGRETLVMISAEEYRRLKALDDRRVYAAEELPHVRDIRRGAVVPEGYGRPGDDPPTQRAAQAQG